MYSCGGDATLTTGEMARGVRGHAGSRPLYPIGRRWAARSLFIMKACQLLLGGMVASNSP